MNEDLLRFSRGIKILSGDWETESLNLNYNLPWQWGDVQAVTGQGVIAKADNYIWWENLNIGKAAAEITRFNYGHYKQRAVPARKVFLEICDKMEWCDILLGSNYLCFDHMVYLATCRELKVPPIPNLERKIYDTVAIGRAIQMGVKFDRKNEDFFWFQMRLMANKPPRGVKAGLAAQCKARDIEFDSESGHHDASYDCMKAYELFMKQIWEIEI